MLRRIFKWTAIVLAVLVAGIVIAALALYWSADLKMPVCNFEDQTDTVVFSSGDSLRTYGDNWLRHSRSGLWEMKITGSAPNRGYAIGKMAPDLMYYQEKAFVDQIRHLIPSDSYLKFLRFFIIIFNRHLGVNVPEEYREEIYGMSRSATHEFDMIGSPYMRQMQYHSAHDLGHALQDYMMVGCSSFSCWGDMTADGGLLTGRNFDFYMGNDFAANRLVTFCFPDKGYRFASVGWPGMIGVLSGMNETGLTVTINAAKSDVPTSSATPISILAREILQYASDIDEAYAIAAGMHTFVSESILISSSRDGRAAIIEKSPDKMSLYQPSGDSCRVICTNHFQSPLFMQDERNLENIRTTDSRYRHMRIREMLDSLPPAAPEDAAKVLRERHGLGGMELGLTNELAVNQLIAHHSVIFKPDSLLMWVSTFPWQCGEYVCYDLNRIFSGDTDPGHEISMPSRTIPHDPFLDTPLFRDAIDYRRLAGYVRKAASHGQAVPQDSISRLIGSNPFFYDSYNIAGDYFRSRGDKDMAVRMWQEALRHPVAGTAKEDAIRRKTGDMKQDR